MQSTEAPNLDAMDRIRIFQHVNRVWRPHLTMQERDFLFYLLDNTICWDRTSFRATINQIVNGSAWLTSVGLSRRSVFRLLNDLRDRGVLRTSTNGRVTTFHLNLDWTPQVLKLPKRLKKPVTTEKRSSFFAPDDSTTVERPAESSVPDWHFRSANLAQQKCQIGTPIKEDALQGNASKTVAERDGRSGKDLDPETPARPRSAREAVELGRHKARARRAIDVERSSETVWRDAHALALPRVRVVPWTRKEGGQMRNLERRAKGAGIHWEDFLSWTVAHWPEIRTAHFGWMTERPPPETPVVGFICGFADKFFDAYAERTADDHLATATGDEADIERLVRSGMSRDAALIELGKRRGVAEQRVAIEQGKAEAARLLRMAEKAQQLPVPAVVRPARPTARVKHGSNPYDDPQAPPPQIEIGEWRDDD